MPTFPYDPNDRPIAFQSFRNPTPPPSPRQAIRWDNIRPLSAGIAKQCMRVTVEMHPPGRTRVFESDPLQQFFPRKDK